MFWGDTLRHMWHCFLAYFYMFIVTSTSDSWGFPGDSGKEPTCQCRRCGFDPWVGKISWRRKWQPPPLCLSGNSLPAPQSMGSQKSWTQLSDYTAVDLVLNTSNNSGSNSVSTILVARRWQNLSFLLVWNPTVRKKFPKPCSHLFIHWFISEWT